MRIPFALQETVSPDRVGYNRPSDTLKLKLGLQRLGFYESDDDTFIPAATEDVWSALRDFQRTSKLKVDAVANPDGPTVKAMNAALVKAPARPIIRGGIRPVTTDTMFKNDRTVRGMGGYSDAGDLPAFMASALYSRNGYGAAPEVADLLKQTRVINPEQGTDMRTRLAELLDPVDMEKIEMAAGVAIEERTTPRPAGDDTLTGQSGADKVEPTDPEPAADPRTRVPLRGGVYSGEFLDAIHRHESARDGYRAYNEAGQAHGRYQLTEAALQDVGMMDKGGNWTGKHGVRSREGFLNNPEAQERATEAYLKKTEGYLRDNGATEHIGQKIDGIKGTITVTEDGLLAAAHRMGHGKVKEYLDHQSRHGWSADVRETAKSDDVEKFQAIETRLRQFQDIKRYK